MQPVNKNLLRFRVKLMLNLILKKMIAPIWRKKPRIMILRYSDHDGSNISWTRGGTNGTCSLTDRTFSRSNKRKAPQRTIDEIFILKVLNWKILTKRFQPNRRSNNKRRNWINAQKRYMAVLPVDRTLYRWKRVLFKAKICNTKGTVQRFKVRLVAQGCFQKYGTDNDEVFALSIRQTTIRTRPVVAA